ncbi:MAG: SdpI family protein [Fimbriimonadaceae bacterium]|nr:MAG: SdpI family protein [Fimbriimonadaceae bacterium]
MNKLWVFLLTCFAIVAATAIYTAMVYPKLPAEIPVHFNAAGVADRYEAKESGAWLMVWMMGGMTALFAILPHLSPKTKSIEAFRSTYDSIVYAVLAFMLLIQFAMLQAAKGQVNVSMYITVAVCGLFAFLGNLMGKVTPNYFVGIRTPWTLESPVVWERTHRLAAKLMTYSAIAGITLALIGASPIVVMAMVITAVLIPVPYSYWVYRDQSRAN